MSDRLTILQGDALTVLKTLPGESVQCCVTSPPYWGLRDYGVKGQLGLERTPEEYVGKMVEVFREVRRVLRGDGTLWLNIGDSYARQAGDDSTKPTDTGFGEGHGTGRTGKSKLLFKAGNNVPPPGLKPKDLCGIPWRLAFALQADGWWLRQDIIWHKPVCPASGDAQSDFTGKFPSLVIFLPFPARFPLRQILVEVVEVLFQPPDVVGVVFCRLNDGGPRCIGVRVNSHTK